MDRYDDENLVSDAESYGYKAPSFLLTFVNTLDVTNHFSFFHCPDFFRKPRAYLETVPTISRVEYLRLDENSITYRGVKPRGNYITKYLFNVAHCIQTRKHLSCGDQIVIIVKIRHREFLKQ
jgi:hypothetical protein